MYPPFLGANQEQIVSLFVEVKRCTTSCGREASNVFYVNQQFMSRKHVKNNRRTFA